MASLGAMLAYLLAPGAAANWVAPQGTSLLAREQEALEGKAAVEEPAPGLRRYLLGGSRATAEAGCPRWLYAISVAQITFNRLSEIAAGTSTKQMQAH